MRRIPTCGGCGRSVTVCLLVPCAERRQWVDRRRQRDADRLRADAIKLARKLTPVIERRRRAVERRLHTELRKARARVGGAPVNVNAERFRAYWQRRAVELGIGAR